MLRSRQRRIQVNVQTHGRLLVRRVVHNVSMDGLGKVAYHFPVCAVSTYVQQTPAMLSTKVILVLLWIEKVITVSTETYRHPGQKRTSFKKEKQKAPLVGHRTVAASLSTSVLK